MTKSIWKKLPQPFFILAPMEAVTDVIFRKVINKAGRPDLFFTEFTNATGWAAAGDKAIGGRLIKESDESPIIAQLWGAKPEAMKLLSVHCKDLGYDGIDINMGCPDSSATKSGGGSAMIKNPELAAEMIQAAKESGLPVSVKTRLGYSFVNEWKDWLTFILKQDIENLTIHLRTKKEMSKVDAHFELIPEIVKLRDEIAPETLLTINGDILTRKQGEEIVKNNPGVNGVMIGRGVFQSPFAFTHDTEKSKEELLDILSFHLDQYDRYSSKTGRPFETLKRFFKIYIRDFNGAAELRDKLMKSTSTDEVREILKNSD